jgi:hypothetical protein
MFYGVIAELPYFEQFGDKTHIVDELGIYIFILEEENNETRLGDTIVGDNPVGLSVKGKSKRKTQSAGCIC